MHLRHALLLSAILLLSISFYLSQLIVTHRFSSISVTIHFNSNLRFANVNVEATYTYTNESTVLAFNYTEPNLETVYRKYEIFTITLNGTSIYDWSSIPLNVQSGGYVQHVFFNVKFGTYAVTVTFQHIEFGIRYWALSTLDEQKLEFTV